MKIVITGGAGFIGSHVVDRVIREWPDADVVVLDAMTYAADGRNLDFALNRFGVKRPTKVKLVIGDIRIPEACESTVIGADLVIHLAAESHVDNSFGNSVKFTFTNTVGTHILLEACRKFDVPRIIHVSTDEVYGQALGEEVHTENSKLNPTNPYAASKASADMIALAYIHSYKMPITITRANNIYGPRQYPEKLIPAVIMKALLGLPLTIHGSGKVSRRFLDVRDFCDAVVGIVHLGALGEIYNVGVGSNNEYTVVAVTRAICYQLGVNYDDHVLHVEDRLFNDSRYAVDSSKLEGLGWMPKRNLMNELGNVVQWYADNQARYKSIFANVANKSSKKK